MKVRKKNKTAQVNPKTLKNFVGESEYGYGKKGGIVHAPPTGPMKGNPATSTTQKRGTSFFE